MRLTIVTLAAMLCLNAYAAADKNSDEALEAAAEQLISEGKSASASGTASASASASASGTGTVSGTGTAPATDSAKSESTPVAAGETNEAKIPVFLTDGAKSSSSSNVLWRLAASAILLVVVGGALFFASRKFARTKDKGGNKARIEIMHQLHLGPRKSVALLRVSGEAFLVGITDHNVSMLKSVTLIDDELEGVLGNQFNNFLEDEFSVQDVRSALDSRV